MSDDTLPLDLGVIPPDGPAFAADMPLPVDRAAYNEDCERRWHGPALVDAQRNYETWEAMRPTLEDWLRAYYRDPQMRDLADKARNPDGTLTAMLWTLQEAIEPNRSCLAPLLDFEEHHQKVFLRRGLIIYCKMILRGYGAHGVIES